VICPLDKTILGGGGAGYLKKELPVNYNNCVNKNGNKIFVRKSNYS
jgi:hypothetical protein